MVSTQWILFLIGYIVLAAAAAATKAHADSYHSTVHYFIPLDELVDFSEPSFDLRHVPSEPKVVRKRALSVLSRWRPFGNLGVRVNSVHKQYPPSRRTLKMSHSPGSDYSGETEGSARPLGQPLRWGRKR